MTPAISIITPNSLAALGLQRILTDSFPACRVHSFSSFSEFNEKEGADLQFIHYFVDVLEVMQGAQFFLQRQRAVIVMVRGAHDLTTVPQGFRTLNIFQPLKALTYALAEMAQAGHRTGAGGTEFNGDTGMHPAPGVVKSVATLPHTSELTPREREVLRGLAGGKINKEIAAAMGINTTTVITHRKNITAKLGLKSVSALTVYALMHGIVRVEEVEHNL